MSTIVWDRTAHGGGHGHCTPWLNFLLFCASGSHESVNLPVELSTNCSQHQSRSTGPAPAPLARPPILRVSQERLRRAQPWPHPPGGRGAQPPRRRPDLARTFQRNGEHEYMTTTTIITAYGCTSTTEEP